MNMYRRTVVKIPSINPEYKRGRPADKGINPSDNVCSFIEFHRRIFISQGFIKNALQKAKDLAAISFVDLIGLKVVERTIERDWEKGKIQAQGLSSESLESIFDRSKVF
jgi:hypothetical protein